jgi:capsular exopolysaccharide synthesis family protein
MQNILTGMLESADLRLLNELDRLQNSLDVVFKPGQRRVLAFMGALPGEGATALALHYSFFLARADQDVLLLDSDMAHSSYGLSEGMDDFMGVAELLRGESTADQVVFGTEERHMHFLTAGRDTARHVELVHSERLPEMLSELGRRYHTVVLDVPPVMSNPEAPIIASHCDGVVFVVSARRTRREIVQKAVMTLQAAKARVLGTVLNKRVHDIPRFIYHRV